MTCMRSLLLLGSFSSFAHLRGWSPINSQKAVFIVVKIDSIFLKVRLFISISLWNTLFYWNIIWTSGLIRFLTLWLIIYCYCQSSHNYARHRMKFPEVLNIFKSLWQFRQMYYGGKCKNKSESKLPVNMEPSKKIIIHVFACICIFLSTESSARAGIWMHPVLSTCSVLLFWKPSPEIQPFYFDSLDTISLFKLALHDEVTE